MSREQEDAEAMEVAAQGSAQGADAVSESGEERYLRLAADFENFKRRKNQELVDRSRYASEDAVRVLIPVLDNLERALAHIPEAEQESELAQGLAMVARDFEERLTQLGVQVIPTVGELFDPTHHEAIAAIESDEFDQETVVDEVQTGYMLHDRIIRPAMVRVAHPRHPATAE